jgi:hypothetical protein
MVHGGRVPLLTTTQPGHGPFFIAGARPQHVHLSYGGIWQNGHNHKTGRPNTCPLPSSPTGRTARIDPRMHYALPSLLALSCMAARDMT